MSQPIAWDLIKPAIKAQISQLSDVPIDSVNWVDEPSGLVNGRFPAVWLRVKSIVGVGIEEERIQGGLNPQDDQVVNMCGQRQFTLSIRCESFTSDLADDRFAGNICEKIRTRIMRSSAREQRAGLFAISQKLGVNWFSYMEANRPVNTYVLDLLCTTVANDIDTTDASGDWIGEALVSGPVKDTADDSTLGTVNVDANAK